MFFPVIIRKTTKLLKNPFEYTAALCCILIWLKTSVPHQHFYIKHIGKFNKGYWKVDASDEVLTGRAHSTDRCPSGPQDKIFLAVVEGMRPLPSCICLLAVLGTTPTSLQITALAECIQIITTQRPSQLLLLRHFLNLHVTRKHLFEGWASHKFRSTWIYGKVGQFLSQVVLFFSCLWERALDVLIAWLVLIESEGFLTTVRVFVFMDFCILPFYFIVYFPRYFSGMLLGNIYLYSNCHWHSISQ